MPAECPHCGGHVARFAATGRDGRRLSGWVCLSCRKGDGDSRELAGVRQGVRDGLSGLREGVRGVGQAQVRGM